MRFRKENWVTNESEKPLTGAIIIPFIVLIFAIWLPFGFSLTGLIEEWEILDLFTLKGHFYFTDANGSLADHALRPLTIFPHALAYFLDSNSFNYWHFLLIISLIVKEISFGLLIWQVTQSKQWAIIGGILILVYPADTMQLSFRALHINWALVCLLLASSLLITAFRAPKKTTSYLTGFIASSLLWASLGMYETSLPLVGLPFFIIYAQQGLKESISTLYKRKDLVALWVLSIVIYLLFVKSVASKITGYQHSLLGEQHFFNILSSRYSFLFSPGLIRNILGGWFDAFRIFITEFSLWGYFYVFISASIIAGLGIRFSKNNTIYAPDQLIQKTISLIRLLIIGLLLSLLGYLPYLVSKFHIAINQRTFSFAQIGGGLFWVALLMLLAKWKKKLAFCLSFILVLVGLSFQLFQFNHYVNLSERSRTILKNIVDYYDEGLANHPLILLDESNQINQLWLLRADFLKKALSYFLKKPVQTVEICFMPGGKWQNTEGFFMLRSGSCIEQEDKWIFQSPTEVISGPNYVPDPPAPHKIIFKKDAVVLVIKKDGSVAPVSRINRNKHANQGKDQVKRYHRILVSHPWASYFNKLWAVDSSKYRWSFGDWWSMDLPIQGVGWRPAEWNLGYFYHYAHSLKTEKEASLLFNLVPKSKPYKLQGKFAMVRSESIRKSIQISLNKHLLLFQLKNDGTFEAELPDNVLFPGVNTLTFYSQVDSNYYGLSLALQWVEVLPKG